MLSVTCACGKGLKVKQELVGKKIRCPGCAQVLLVPETVGVSSSSVDQATLPPHGLPPTAADARRTHVPARDTTNQGAQASSPRQDSSKTPDAHAPYDSTLSDFLGPPQADDELGRLGGFRILKILGHGGMGVVFQGEDATLGRQVAIKAMLPHLAQSQSSQQRFLREARAAAALEHDHIVPIFHVGEDRGAPFIVMPLLKGESLDQRLRHDATVPIPEVLRIGREIAEGLAAAHAAGLIHRDIKPANIWLEKRRESRAKSQEPKAGSAVDSSLSALDSPTGAYRVKILDFGLARLTAQDSGLTQQGAIIGTPAYMAPEQGRGAPVDARCDLWSLGVVLYRLCTSQQPFKGGDTVATLMEVATHVPPPPDEVNAEVPARLSDLVMQLLEKDPARRTATAAQVIKDIQEIEQALANQDGRQRPAGKLRQSQTSAGRKRGLFLALGVLAIVALSGSIILFWQPWRGAEKDIIPAGPVDGGAVPVNRPLLSKFTNSLGIDFVLVPKGKAWLGGGGGKPGDKEVDIKDDFYLGAYEVTHEQWEKVVGPTPNYFSPQGPAKNEVKGIADEDLKLFPKDHLTWTACQEFIMRLNNLQKEDGWEYRLPTETEWEYACRGGPLPKFEDYGFTYYLDVYADTLRANQANTAVAGLKRPTKVGSYPPNRLGLFDMHGNVGEWCADIIAKAEGTTARVCRGSNFSEVHCGAAARYVGGPNIRNVANGMRVARVRVK